MIRTLVVLYINKFQTLYWGSISEAFRESILHSITLHYVYIGVDAWKIVGDKSKGFSPVNVPN